VILDTKGNIFGGFTPLEWESGEWHYKEDNSLKSFLFTLKNPHNVPARRFALKPEAKQNAIQCLSTWSPIFGCGYGLAVADDCNTSAKSYTSLGRRCNNDTGLNEYIVFTGWRFFQVKEIEVFEITD
jgi:hypothetical protein